MLSILFVGSLHEDSPDYDEFLQFCRNLGSGVSAQHKILICGTTPRTADHSIAQGAFERLDRAETMLRNCPRVTLYHTENDESQRVRDNELFDRFRNRGDPVSGIKYFSAENDYKAFRQAVSDSDIVTLIGGGEKSADLVDIAIENQKPVLGFTSFGGTGQKANVELRRVYQLLGISDDKAVILQARKMDEYACSSYLDLVTYVHKSNPWSSKNIIRRGAVLVSVLVALALVSVGCMLTSALDGFPRKSFEFIALYASCIAMGLFGAYVVFLKQLHTPGDLLLTRALPATGQGTAIGFGIAAFAQMIIGHVLSQDAIVNDLSFAKLIGLSSLVTFAVAAFGIRGLKKIEDVLGNLPSAT